MRRLYFETPARKRWESWEFLRTSCCDSNKPMRSLASLVPLLVGRPQRRCPGWFVGGGLCAFVAREDGSMKNTGKRIFAAVVFLLVVSAPLLVSAGSLYSQR